MDEYESQIVSPVVIDNLIAKPVSKTEPEYIQCLVCGLEISIPKSLGLCMVDTGDQSSNHMAICLNAKCEISAHSHVSHRNKRCIFKIPEFLDCLVFRSLIMNYLTDYSLL